MVAIVNHSRYGMLIHKAGCADLRKLDAFHATIWTEDHDSVESVVRAVYEDIIAENGDDWPDYLGEFRFFPCCPKLRHLA